MDLGVSVIAGGRTSGRGGGRCLILLWRLFAVSTTDSFFARPSKESARRYLQELHILAVGNPAAGSLAAGSPAVDILVVGTLVVDSLAEVGHRILEAVVPAVGSPGVEAHHNLVGLDLAEDSPEVEEHRSLAVAGLVVDNLEVEERHSPAAAGQAEVVDSLLGVGNWDWT